MIKDLVLGAEYFVYHNGLNKTTAGHEYDVSGMSVFGRYAHHSRTSSTPSPGTTATSRIPRWPTTARDLARHRRAGLGARSTRASSSSPTSGTTPTRTRLKKDDLVFNLTFFLSF